MVIKCMDEHLKANFRPYEGRGSYIFISYSHKDRTQVIPILEMLNTVGYRIWYDAGIQAGSRWNNEIAEHILRCTVFIPLHSKESVQSQYCNREIEYALSHKKTIVPIYLEDDVILPPELDFVLYGIQYRRLSNYNGISDLVKNLEETDKVFQPCKRKINKTAKWNIDKGIMWNLNTSGILTIKKAPGSDGVMPYLAGGLWMYEREKITSVIIQPGITKIASYVFRDYQNLVSVTIPDSVIQIGGSSFRYCTSLTNITIPNGVAKIGGGTFEKCSNLTSIDIPNSVSKMGNYAFKDCINLTNITISENLTKINDYTFLNCVKLKNIIIPNSVFKIGAGAFKGCRSLTHIIIPDSITIIPPYAFDGCMNLKSVVISDSVKEINLSAFHDCVNLKCIEISKNTKIDPSAFDSATTFIWR